MKKLSSFLAILFVILGLWVHRITGFKLGFPVTARDHTHQVLSDYLLENTRKYEFSIDENSDRTLKIRIPLFFSDVDRNFNWNRRIRGQKPTGQPDCLGGSTSECNFYAFYS